eukprot:3125776-Prymnesium_polylepis.1
MVPKGVRVCACACEATRRPRGGTAGLAHSSWLRTRVVPVRRPSSPAVAPLAEESEGAMASGRPATRAMSALAASSPLWLFFSSAAGTCGQGEG